MSRAPSIAIFGGSFNPPHLGHVLCATYAYCVGTVDAVWVFPVANHPYASKRSIRPWVDRWHLCQAAFDGLGFVELRDDELHNPSGSTYDLVQLLKKHHPDTHWHLVGGTDTQNDLKNWHRGDELLQDISVIPVPRAGFDTTTTHALPDITSTLVRKRIAAGEEVSHLLPRRVWDIIASNGWYSDCE